MATIAWTLEAQTWLRNIHEYIAADSPAAAERTIAAIIARTSILQTFPEIGYRYDHARNIRVLLYGHYRIAYLIKAGSNIDILGVFHGKLDIEQFLK